MSDKLWVVLSFLRNSYSLSLLWIITCFIRISVITNKATTVKHSSAYNSQFNFDGYSFNMERKSHFPSVSALAYNTHSVLEAAVHSIGADEHAHFTYPPRLRCAAGLGT